MPQEMWTGHFTWWMSCTVNTKWHFVVYCIWSAYEYATKSTLASKKLMKTKFI